MFRRAHLGKTGRALAASAVATAFLAVLAVACSGPGTAHPASGGSTVTTHPDPGRVRSAVVRAAGVDLTISDAVAHLDRAGTGTLTFTVRNGTGVPEHLDMIGTPDAGRGALRGAAIGVNGSLTTAGILIQPDSTVTFGGRGPGIRLTRVHGVTSARTLPLVLEFGVARLVHLTARVSPS